MVKERKPIMVGNRYTYPGYEKNGGFQITGIALPGHPENDGGCQGVGIKWYGWLKRHRKRGWYPVKSEDQFWNILILSHAVSAD